MNVFARQSFIGNAAIGAVCTLMTAHTPALGCDAPRVLDRVDLNGDGIPEIVSASPCLPNAPGRIDITDGATGQRIARIVGSEVGDQFGSAIAYGGDLNRNGSMDLIVGAPGINTVYVVSVGPVIDIANCRPVIAIHSVDDVAHRALTTTSTDLFDVGYDVAAGYDFREDGHGTFRFAARYELPDGSTGTREYIVHGSTGLFLARVERYIQTDGVARERGDATGDGQVTHDDLQIVLDNYGIVGTDLTYDDGDFIGDDEVGADDLLLTMNRLNQRVFDPTSVSPPADFMNVQSDGCDQYYAQGEDGQWYHVELFGFGCAGPIGASAAAAPSDCLEDLLEQCSEHEGVQKALDLLEERCGDGNAEDDTSGTGDGSGSGSGSGTGSGSGSSVAAASIPDNLTVYCIACDDPPDDFEEQIPGGPAHIVPKPNGDMVIVICTDRFDSSPYTICSALAHELIHASQYCEYGIDDDWCDFVDQFNNDCNRMCREYEAFKESGNCDDVGLSDDDCCRAICRTYNSTWCEDECKDFCDSIEECCSGGSYTCDDRECKPYLNLPPCGDDDDEEESDDDEQEDP